VNNKDFIKQNIDWLSKNPMKVNRFDGKKYLWYITLPGYTTRAFTHEEYEYYLSCVNQTLGL